MEIYAFVCANEVDEEEIVCVGGLVEQPDTAHKTDKTMVKSAVIARRPILTCALSFLYFDLRHCGLHLKHLPSISKKFLDV